MKALGEQGSQYAERDWFRHTGLYYLHTRISRRATYLKRNVTRRATSCRCFITIQMGKTSALAGSLMNGKTRSQRPKFSCTRKFYLWFKINEFSCCIFLALQANVWHGRCS